MLINFKIRKHPFYALVTKVPHQEWWVNTYFKSYWAKMVFTPKTFHKLSLIMILYLKFQHLKKNQINEDYDNVNTLELNHIQINKGIYHKLAQNHYSSLRKNQPRLQLDKFSYPYFTLFSTYLLTFYDIRLCFD